MKKLYLTIALLSAVVASMSASEVVQMQKTAKIFGQPSMKYEKKDALSKVKQAGPKKISTAFDIESAYVCEYTTPMEQYTPADAVIEATGNEGVIITLNPWASKYSNITMDPIVASVDTQKSTLTIASPENMEIGTFTDEDGTEMWLSVIVAEVQGEEYVQTESVTANITANNTIEFPETTRIFFAVGVGSEIAGYVGVFDGLKFLPPNYFSFNKNEWTLLGEGAFDDQFTNRIFKEEYQVKPVNVNIYKNKADESLYCVENPYKDGGWTQLNADPETSGYIVFSIENPNFVWMRPLTGSGFWLDLFDNGIPEEMFMANLEGDFVFNQGYTVDGAAAKFKDAGVEASKYNEKTGVIKFVNPYFGVTSDPFASYNWTNVENGYLQITMPVAGVEGIINDAENVTKRYFNLQGVEIANPEAGQIVIVKEGNKATKTVIR